MLLKWERLPTGVFARWGAVKSPAAWAESFVQNAHIDKRILADGSLHKYFLAYHSMHILYQDKHIIVVDKPSNLLSTPGSLDDSVVHRLEKQFSFVGVIHRLDQATSGIMIFALNSKAQSNLAKQFQHRETFKVYEARVKGILPAEKGTIDLPLICDWPNRPRQEVNSIGKQSLTHWQTIDATPDWSRVQLIPHTGRSHQLRVHLMALGHPILGDYFYGQNPDDESDAHSMDERLNLHACQLHINHPVTGKRLQFISRAPF